MTRLLIFKMLRNVACFALFAALFASMQPATAQTNHFEKYKFYTIDIPGAPVSTITTLNEYGEFVGLYMDGVGHWHGFYGKKNWATIYLIDYPGATQTCPTGMNESGLIAGTWFDNIGVQHGFTATRAFPMKPSYFTSFDCPMAVPGFLYDFEFGFGLGTSFGGVNNYGVIVGQYADAKAVGHGLLFQSGQWTRYDYPGSNAQPGFIGGSGIIRINDVGEFVGAFTKGADYPKGFVVKKSGRTVLAPPGSVGSQAFGISHNGVASGFYYDNGFIGHGFTYNNGIYTIYDAPGAFYITTVASVNNSGELAGEYVDIFGITHGYIAIPKK